MPENWYPEAITHTTPWQSSGKNAGRRYPASISAIVMHHTEGGWDSVIATFGPNSERLVSAHFMVGRDGRVAQFVALDNIAHHAGVWDVNVHTIGIEHEHYRYLDDNENEHWSTFTDVQLNASARLIRWIWAQAQRIIPLKRHWDFRATACPGDLPVEDIVARAGKVEQIVIQAQLPEKWKAPTGYELQGGFYRGLWLPLEKDQMNLRAFGLPKSVEFDYKFPGMSYARRHQICERAVFCYDSYNSVPWDLFCLPDNEAEIVRAFAIKEGINYAR